MAWTSPESRGPERTAGSRSKTSRRPPGSRAASRNHPLSLKRAARLGAKKHRETERLFLAEGESLVHESPQAPLQTFSEPEQIKKISSLSTPPVMVGVFTFLDVPPDKLLSSRERIVLLDGVQDPGNVGTVVRSARAFGAGVALSKGCADLYNSKTVRGTMGSIFHAPVSRELDAREFIREAREAGFASIAAVPESGRAPDEMPSGKLVIVVGTEGSGLAPGTVRECDASVSIPSLAASLNAAVAASILLHEAYSRVLP